MSETNQPITPFPGMDPYLEHPVLWEGFHTQLIVEIGRQLSPKLRPRYVTSVEERVYIEVPDQQRKPDVWIQQVADEPPNAIAQTDPGVATPVVVEVPEIEIKERSIEILDRYQEFKVVAVLEVVSPSNKRDGVGRDSYIAKQRSTLESQAHLVELDLMRRGSHVVAVPEAELPAEKSFEYLVSVNRWPHRSRFELYPIRLREPLPRFQIPLAEDDADVVLDLQAAVEQVYESGSFMLRVKYNEPCVPALSEDDQRWADGCWADYTQTRTDLFPA